MFFIVVAYGLCVTNLVKNMFFGHPSYSIPLYFCSALTQYRYIGRETIILLIMSQSSEYFELAQILK